MTTAYLIEQINKIQRRIKDVCESHCLYTFESSKCVVVSVYFDPEETRLSKWSTEESSSTNVDELLEIVHETCKAQKQENSEQQIEILPDEQMDDCDREILEKFKLLGGKRLNFEVSQGKQKTTTQFTFQSGTTYNFAPTSRFNERAKRIEQERQRLAEARKEFEEEKKREENLKREKKLRKKEKKLRKKEKKLRKREKKKEEDSHF